MSIGTTTTVAHNFVVPFTSNDPRLEQWHAELSKHGQQHVLDFWNEISEKQRDELITQLESLDLENIERLYKSFDNPTGFSTDPEQFAEPTGFGLNDDSPRFSKFEAKRVGEELLRAGTVGCVIVAGGQGTRLGFPHPKGMYPIGPLSDATLFEILLTKIKAVGQRYGKNVPLYLMTSPATHAETVRFLDEHDRFGLSADDLRIFCQGTMPAVEIETGKLLLADKHRLFQSPDGHGGMLAALDRTGAFDHMQSRGIEHLFYMQIDNALVDVADPTAIGYHVLSNSDATTMVIRKTNPLEKVGNVAVLDGKMQIVEYSDLPEQVAKIERPDGSLQLWAGNVAVHVWDVSFLEATARSATGLPFHYARKKVPHVNFDGQAVKPDEPNGIKFERFIFDLLPAARRAIVVEVPRDEYFAPLKNPTGSETDSPETVKQQIATLHHKWIEACGGMIANGVTVEIQPSYAATLDELRDKVEPGTEFNEDKILG